MFKSFQTLLWCISFALVFVFQPIYWCKGHFVLYNYSIESHLNFKLSHSFSLYNAIAHNLCMQEIGAPGSLVTVTHVKYRSCNVYQGQSICQIKIQLHFSLSGKLQNIFSPTYGTTWLQQLIELISILEYQLAFF